MKLKYSPRALEDIERIRQYISKENPSAAWVVASFIRRSIRSLEDFPFRGRATEIHGVRRLAVTNYPYVVYYKPNEKFISILYVRHTAQDH